MQALTRKVLAHKRAVALSWLLLTIVGMAAAGPASEALDQRFSVPGREGWDTSERIAVEFGNGGDALPFVPVVTLPQGTRAADVRQELLALEGTVAEAAPGSRVAGFGSTGSDAFVSADGRTTFIYAFPKRSSEPFGANAKAERRLSAALAGTTIAGAPVKLTGYDSLIEASGEDSQGTGVLLEAVIGGVGALIVLIFVFGSALALVPIFMAISSILVSFLLLWGLTADHRDLTGGAVPRGARRPGHLDRLRAAGRGALARGDRGRRDRRRRRDRRDGDGGPRRRLLRHDRRDRPARADRAAAARSCARWVTAGMLIPLVATTAAITLLPVLLATIGPRMDRRRIKRRDRSDRFWQRWSQLVVRHRIGAIVAALALLVALIVSASGTCTWATRTRTRSPSPARPRRHSSRCSTSGIGAGAMTPTETLVPSAEAAAVAAAQGAVEHVHGAAAPAGDAWTRDGTSIVVTVPVFGDERQEGRDAVQNFIDAAHDASPAATVGGSGPLNADFIDAVYGSFPLLIVLISLVTFLLLARAFRSIVLPAKAIVLNVLSIGAAWGVMTLVWQNGHGSEEIWGIAATGSIASWIPFMVFAFLYGLSMDYEVFILSRMREEYDKTGDTDSAVITGLGRTGRLVTSAALILFLAFSAMASGPGTDIKILATGFAAGILIDATIIRALLVPAVVSLFGRWNWWLPPRAASLLRVPPSPLREGA